MTPASPRPLAGLPERLASAGLAIAALTIFALALAMRFELDREASLHREMIAGLQVRDSLEALRTQLTELRGAARVAAATRSPEAAATIERRAVEADAELEYLAQQAIRSEAGETFERATQAARLLVVVARSVPRAPADAARLAGEIERLSASAESDLEATLRVQRRIINEGTLAQLRLGDGLRTYVAWLLAGSIALLVGLFAVYRRARGREQEALRRIRHLAHHDVVTGLPNRALLGDRLQQEAARAKRSGQGFAVLMLDLDGFKAVNDTWGHAAGDLLLSIVAERLRACMRASDTVARVGGDEFLALLPETSRDGALAVAEKIRTALEAPYALRDETARLSTSIGAAFFPADGEDVDALQRVADAALYEAKRSGKNRIATPSGDDARGSQPADQTLPVGQPPA